MKRTTLFAAAMLTLAFAVGCQNWERTTFQALSASKTTLDSAQAAYEVSASTGICPTPSAITPACIPHTAAAYKTITDAKVLQKGAVDAMVVYEELKAANAAPDALAKAEADVEVALAALSTITGDVKSLYAVAKGN